MNATARPMLGIIAGDGRLPEQLLEACRAQGRETFVLSFDDIKSPVLMAHEHNAVVRLGAIGEALSHLRNAGVKEVVMAGRVRRPPLSSLKPDAAGLKLLGRMSTAFLGGDDAMLRTIITFLEDEGFAVVGADDILIDLVSPQGLLGSVAPNKQDLADIAKGLRVAKAIGVHDIGQAVVVENSYVLGVEGPEGTDALVARCASLKNSPNAGVLVKAKKPSQESRVDLPTVGPHTVEVVHKAGLRGIAVEAGGSLILDREQVVARADTLGIFVMGVKDE